MTEQNEPHEDGFTVIEVGSEEAIKATVVELVAAGAGHHHTMIDSVECAFKRAMAGMLADMFRQTMWWADLKEASNFAISAADRLLEDVTLNVRTAILLGTLGQHYVNLSETGATSPDVVKAFTDAKGR